MKDFQYKRRWRRVLYSKSVLLVLLVLLVVAIQATWGVFEKQRQARETADVVDRELSDLKNRNEILARQIGRLETERGVEDVIRDSYQVAREGENIVVVVDDQKPSPVSVVKSKTVWDKIKSWFAK